MRVSRYLVTAIDTVGPEGKERKLTILPSESLPEQQPIKPGALEKMKQLLYKFNEKYAERN